MSEWNTIYDTSDNIVGVFRHGVAWRKEPKERLGEYDEKSIYSNESELVANIVDDKVVDDKGKIIGRIIGKDLYLAEKKVGKFAGNKSAGAAAIVLLFNHGGTAL